MELVSDNEKKPEDKVKAFPKAKKGVWRIEGADFFEVRKLVLMQEKADKECQKIMETAAKECMSKMQNVHEAMWNRIYKILDLDKKISYTLDRNAMDAGLIIVRTHDGKKSKNHLLAQILQGLLD